MKSNWINAIILACWTFCGFFVGFGVGSSEGEKAERAIAQVEFQEKEALSIADAFGRGREAGITEMQQQALARGVGEMVLDENEQPQWRWRKLVIRTVTPRPTPLPEVPNE
jgi:hypothetical protein